MKDWMEPYLFRILVVAIIFSLHVLKAGFRIRHILTGGSGSFGYGST